MASFCRQCAEELDFEPDFTGYFTERGITPDGVHGFPVLCETCGTGCFIIDDKGTCGSFYCHGSIHARGPHGGPPEAA
jgi:hypothetical protein